MDFAAIISTSLIVGIMVGLTGVGGGAIMTPALIILFQVSPVVAVATDLVFATVTKIVAAALHSKRGAVDWRTTRLIWGGSIPGTIVGIALVVTFGAAFGVWLGVLLATVLLATSVSMLRAQVRSANKNWGDSKTRFGGALIGFSVATTSVGAGALGMALLRSRLGDSDPRKLVGTDIVHAVPIALIAGVSYGFSGFIDFELLTTLLIGSVPGVILGSHLAGKINTVLLRRILGVMLSLAAIGVLVKIL